MAECLKLNRGGGSSGGGQFSGRLFGAEWDGSSSPLWMRTDDSALFPDPVAAVNNGNGSSPFDYIMPWAGMVREERTGGTMVKIPKYWYKWTRDGAKMKLQITPDEATAQADGFFTAPAHADRGDGNGERDYVYIGAFYCASDYKSTTGVLPVTSKSRATFRSEIHALGANIWQSDFAMFWTWAMLYLVEYANWNSQGTIGYGGGNGSSKENNGSCDSMIYHTGTNAATRNTYGHIRYRWIEGLWDNVYEWCDGIYFSGTSVYCINNPADFSDSSGGTLVGTRPTNTGSIIVSWTNPSVSGFEYALYPNISNGRNNTYVCDSSLYNANGVVLGKGGSYYTPSTSFGAFHLRGGSLESDAPPNYGSRIMELP